jgi:Arc/MetJ-type ribon-helix-helix transcriptional regulator
MTTPVPTRFSDDELALIDDLVRQGVGDSRSAVIRLGVHRLADLTRRARIGAAIAASYEAFPQTPEDDDAAMTNAIAMTEAEAW